MSTSSLPEHPDLDQLRRKAKELRNAARASDPAAIERLNGHAPGTDPHRLATAQLVVAREYGFPSWPKLRAAVLDRTAEHTQRVESFLYESIAGRDDRPVRMLREHPSITGYDFRAAVVSGDADALRPLLAADSGLAVRPDRTTGWPPLLGACMSRWHHLDPAGSAGLLQVARLLLDAGADPDTTVGGRPGRPEYCSTLFAAAGVRANAELTELLLDAGATPDAHTVYLAAFHDDHRPLQLLLEHGAPVDDTALAAPLTTGDAAVARLLLLDARADAGRMIPPEALGEGDPGELPVPVAVRDGHPAELVELLLQHGGDPSTPARDGQTPYRLAVRQGRRDLADLLAGHGARPDTAEVDLFLDACLRADRAEAKRLVDADPGLVERLTDTDRAAILQAADTGNAPAMALLLDLGFAPDEHTGVAGTTPLHVAAGAGSVEVVQLLIDRGADVAARDKTWDSTPAVWASVGSGMRLGRAPMPDWLATIELLVSAGASLADAWLTGAKAPSPEVADLLRGHGVSDPAG